VYFIGLSVVVIGQVRFAEKVKQQLQQAKKQPEQLPDNAGILAEAQERIDRLEKEQREPAGCRFPSEREPIFPHNAPLLFRNIFLVQMPFTRR